METVEKALKLLSNCNDSGYKIANRTGITESTIGNYRNGKTKPTRANAMVLLQYFSNYTDLMTDKEVDELDEKNIEIGRKSAENYNAKLDGHIESIPLIPIEAMAGFGTGEMQIMEYECERYVIPMFRDAEFLISVKGSSMIPKYNSGDLVACRKVPIDTFFQWNKVYVLDTEQGALIKRIKQGSDKNHIKIVSDNKSYDPFELHKSKINSIAIVVGVMRLE